eukprot:TRINITY_DN1116_c0_g1_i2.p2 TRINITY_DN1116_c0_g1~~TRINITY_DN1116_c0_g1_i2.p2  ORF type:complete len:187 (+),score=58.46 TRINITY_DN1116_c0_g1_i2:134-694(+)
MKLVRHSDEVAIPEGVEVLVHARHVRVTGPRGVLRRAFTKINAHIKVEKKKVIVEMWFGRRRQLAAVRTVCSHIENMVKGVTKGFEYKMRFVYAHFPINSAISEDNKEIKINNFLGEKQQRVVRMLPGVTVHRNDKVKDEILIRGNSIESVSICAAKIHNSTSVKGKDIRKFLDGIYVSEKGVLAQ